MKYLPRYSKWCLKGQFTCITKYVPTFQRWYLLMQIVSYFSAEFEDICLGAFCRGGVLIFILLHFKNLSILLNNVLLLWSKSCCQQFCFVCFDKGAQSNFLKSRKQTTWQSYWFKEFAGCTMTFKCSLNLCNQKFILEKLVWWTFKEWKIYWLHL